MTRRRLIADRSGGVAVMMATAGALLCALTAIAVDIAALALSARTLQGAADLAALSAVIDLDRGEAAAVLTAEANVPAVRTGVEIGRYTADPARAPDTRFVPGDAPSNAARVTLSREAPLYFGRWILGRRTVTLTRAAVAARAAEPPRAIFSIGSRLARLDGGVANQLLSGLTGSTVSLSVMDYQALARAEVDLLTYAEALATDLDLTLASHEALLQREIETARALRVLRDLAGDQGDTALSRLMSASGQATIRLGDLIGVEADAPDGVMERVQASVSALDLAMAMIETGGERQARLALGARPGLADLRVDLAIGERPNRSPWLTVTGTGQPIVRTAQARLYVRARTAQSLSGLTQVSLPVLIELAPSEARLDALSCEPRWVTLGVRPGLARAVVGEIDGTRLDDFTRSLTPAPATLVHVLGLVKITGRAEVEAADPGFRSTRFSAADIDARTVKTVTARHLGEGLMASLLSRLEVDVRTLGLGLGLGGLTSALATLLAPVGPALDAAVNPVLEAPGAPAGRGGRAGPRPDLPGRGGAPRPGGVT